MSRYRPRCRCGSDLNADKKCPHGWPPPDARFRHRPAGKTPAPKKPSERARQADS